jgi:hypothetical protein
MTISASGLANPISRKSGTSASGCAVVVKARIVRLKRGGKGADWDGEFHITREGKEQFPFIFFNKSLLCGFISTSA